MGEKKLFQLVLSAATDMFIAQGKSGGYSLRKGGIFHHAVATAMTAYEISVFTGCGVPDIAYTAGLLHDIGKAALDQLVADAPSFFYGSMHDNGMDLCKTEKEIFGMSHTRGGAVLARKWKLPENLVNAIQYHHTPQFAPGDKELVTIINLADLILAGFEAGYQSIMAI